MRLIQPRGLFPSLLLLAAALPQAPAAADGGRSNAASSDIDTTPFEQSIATIERDHGALDHRLSEHLLGLGLAYRANGDFDNAAAAFQQALHVNRINKGLHNLVHVPIVDLLIESYARLGDWQAVEQQHRYRYWIHRREVDANSDDFVDAAIVFSAWETRAYDLDTGVPSFRQLRDAQDALDAAQETIEANHPTGDPRLIDILNAQALANLNLARYVSTTAEDPATGGPTTGEDIGDIIQRRNIIIESFMRGKEALEHVVSLTDSQASPVQHGLALANLADWELVFDRPQSSVKNYRRAYELLRSAGLSQDELAIEFGRPHAMSRFSIERRKETETAAHGSDEAYVVASFDVTRSGKVRNVKIVETYPAGDRKIIRHARRTLRATRFRPSIGRDGPIKSSSTIRYVFPDESV